MLLPSRRRGRSGSPPQGLNNGGRASEGPLACTVLVRQVTSSRPCRPRSPYERTAQMVMLAERSESSAVAPNSAWEAAQTPLPRRSSTGSHRCLLLVCSGRRPHDHLSGCALGISDLALRGGLL